MKIECTQENLIKGLNAVSHITGKNISLPILNNILLRAKDGQFVLTSTNLDIGIKTPVRSKIEQEGELTVQSKLFTEYISLLPTGNIGLSLKGDDLMVKTSQQETVIKGQSAEDYPIVPSVDEAKKISLKSVDFKSTLTQVIFSAAYDDLRPELSGVLFKVSGEGLILAATDSYRLAEKKIKVDNPEKHQLNKIIPLRALQEVARLLEDKDEKIEVGFSDNQVVFKINEVTIISRLIEGNYPDYKEIIPAEWKTRAVANRHDLVKIVKTAGLFSKTGINDVLLEFDKDKTIKISAANVQLGESKSTMSTEIEGEHNSVIFNYRYLLEALQNLSGKNVIFEVNSSDMPVILKSEQDKDYLCLIMPIRK